MLTSVGQLFSIFCSRRRPVSTAEFSFGSRMAALSQAFWTCTSVFSQIVRVPYFICNHATPMTWSLHVPVAPQGLCGETQPEAAEQSSFKQSTKGIKGNIIARHACSMESWKIRRYITEPWSKHFSGLKFWSSKVKLHADQGSCSLFGA